MRRAAAAGRTSSGRSSIGAVTVSGERVCGAEARLREVVALDGNIVGMGSIVGERKARYDDARR